MSISSLYKEFMEKDALLQKDIDKIIQDQAAVLKDMRNAEDRINKHYDNLLKSLTQQILNEKERMVTDVHNKCYNQWMYLENVKTQRYKNHYLNDPLINEKKDQFKTNDSLLKIEGKTKYILYECQLCQRQYLNKNVIQMHLHYVHQSNKHAWNEYLLFK